MARTPRPWFRKQTGWWMVTLGGQQHKLAEGREHKKLAQKKFHELQLLVAEAPESGNMRVASLCDAFLQWSEGHQAERPTGDTRLTPRASARPMRKKPKVRSSSALDRCPKVRRTTPQK